MSSPVPAFARALPTLLLTLLVGCAGSTDGKSGGEDAHPADSGAEGGGEGADGAAVDIEPLGLNDVSVLFPKPPTYAAPGYLLPSSVGAHGELLPRSIFEAVPVFGAVPADALTWPLLTVISARVDACAGPAGACDPELRLVLQPVEEAGRVRDSALHVFYSLDAAEMDALVAGLRGLRALAPEARVDGPLEVHPALVAQGVEGAYGEALRALLLEHIGADRIRRVTFFLRAPPATPVWFMGGFEVEGGALTALDILNVGPDTQQVILDQSSGGYLYDVNPPAGRPEDGALLLSSEAVAAASEGALAEVMASYLRVDDPLTYRPDDLPCAGCHLSTFVQHAAAEARGLSLGPTATDGFTTARDLSLTGGAAAEPVSLRAFGYFDETPMISQRTVNETAAVVDDIEARGIGAAR